jgi:hypothetical protein
MIRHTARLLLWTAVFPGVLAHEAVHALTARLLGASSVEYVPGVVGHTTIHAPLARAVGAEITPYKHDHGQPRVRIQWEQTPAWRVRIAHLAPTILAPVVLLPGASVIAWALVELPPLIGLPVAATVLLNIVFFADPSEGDLKPEVAG